MEKHENEEMQVIIDDSGKLADYISNPHFPHFLLGITACTIALVLGIYAAIRILDATERIPDILTNKYGVVINSGPDKQVCYFLLNSSQYWAETGIHVNKGDLVSVYASGSINTGIHHVVKAASDNTKPDFDWISPKGKEVANMYRDQPADELSLDYRVQKNENLGSLLMMVSTDKQYKEYVEQDVFPFFNNSIVTIGEGKSKIRVNKNGMLYFCVNEVYLSAGNIIDLRQEYIDYVINHETQILEDETAFLKEIETNHKLDLTQFGKDKDNKQYRSVAIDKNDYLAERYKNEADYKGDDKIKGIMRVYSRIFELEDYFNMGYRTPWYDDNLGSYLVVVEIEKHD